MKRIQTTCAQIYQFADMTEVVNFSDKDLYVPSSAEFTGEDLPSWERVEEKTLGCWSDGMLIIHEFVERLSKLDLAKDVKSRRRSVTYGTSGDDVDLERMQQGDPNFMRSYRSETAEGPGEIAIIVDTSTPAVVHASDIFWRGGVALALTKLLEEKGYKTEIHVVNGSTLFSGESLPVVTSCCLKRCQDPLDISTLCNTLAGWFYRSVTFTLYLTLCNRFNKTPSWGLGSAYTAKFPDLKAICMLENPIFVSGVFSFSAAADLVQAEVAKLPSNEASE